MKEDVKQDKLATIMEEVAPANSTLAGDLRDFLYAALIHEQDARPIDQQPEAAQKWAANACDRIGRAMVEIAVKMVAAEGRTTIEGRLKDFSRKESTVEGKVLFPTDDDTLIALNHLKSGNAAVLLVVADDTPFVGARGSIPIKKDQAELVPSEDDRDFEEASPEELAAQEGRKVDATEEDAGVDAVDGLVVTEDTPPPPKRQRRSRAKKG